MSTVSIDVAEIAKISEQLQHVQRQRRWHAKTKMMIYNRLIATVAYGLGYDKDMPKSKRKEFYKKALNLIKAVVVGEEESEWDSFILPTWPTIDAHDEEKKNYEKKMLTLAKQLHVADWVQDEQQRGFGLQNLSYLIGETGDLNNYENPSKVWKRMGCAPFIKEGIAHTGEGWRKFAKKADGITLHSDDWVSFGYSPRRRAVAYVIGESLCMLNKSIYRDRRNDSKAKFLDRHPEARPIHCDKHGKLMATKLLIRNLWIEWTGSDLDPREAWSA